MIQLSVVIITFNEEKNIERCLQSVQHIADEIIVVDSFSTDETENICKRYKVSFTQKKWGGYSKTKNYANSLASHDYIFSIDADEEVTPELNQSILTIKNNYPSNTVFEVSRRSNYCGKWINYCGWSPDKKIRVWKKGTTEWKGSIHEGLELAPGLTIKLLAGKLNHYTFRSIKQHTKQIELFTDLSSTAAFEKGKKSSWLKIYFKTVFKFFRDFFLKLGFLDGYYGFIICKKSAHAKYLKYYKLLKLYQSNENTSS